jgi:hypothetical protein
VSRSAINSDEAIAAGHDATALDRARLAVFAEYTRAIWGEYWRFFGVPASQTRGATRDYLSGNQDLPISRENVAISLVFPTSIFQTAPPSADSVSAIAVASEWPVTAQEQPFADLSCRIQLQHRGNVPFLIVKRPL